MLALFYFYEYSGIKTQPLKKGWYTMKNFEKGTLAEFQVHKALNDIGVDRWPNIFDGLSIMDACKMMDYEANQPIQHEHMEYNRRLHGYNANMKHKSWFTPEQETKIRKLINERVKTIDSLPYKRQDEAKRKAMDTVFPPFLAHDPVQAFIDMNK